MNTIYIRTLKRAEHTVFCVEDGQKSFYDPQFKVRVPYSSGQQVKRSILEELNNQLNITPSPITFYSKVNKKKEIGEGEVHGTCNPAHPDQLLGGWMNAAKGGAKRTIKRRSPLSISAMRGLHPLLAGVRSENITFDRSDRPNNHIVVRDEKDNILSEEQIAALLEGKDRSLVRKWIPGNNRATGLFVQDIAIDLRRLFTVSLSKIEPEITDEVEAQLREEGWTEGETVFGKCLVCPKELREKWAKALVSAIINWRITSNQSRTFSLMETLAVSISDNANLIAGSIRAKLTEDERATPVIEEDMVGVDTFVTLSAAGYVPTQKESADALAKAEAALLERIMAFDAEKQLAY